MKAKFPTAGCGVAVDRRQAFTLIELLVVIGMLALLATIQVSAMAGAGGRSKVAMCSGNLRQQTLALHLYAGDNKDKLPVFTGAAAWPWDIPRDVGNKLLACGLQKRTFYCPGTAPRFTDADNFQNANSLWNFSSSFYIVGYVIAFSGGDSKILIYDQNSTVLAEPARPGALTLPPPPPNSERVLVADATVSGNRAPAPTSNFTDIVGGFYKPHTSPHLRGRIPDGCNLGFKDGHVAWRKFDDMRVRTTSGPWFWW